MSFYGLVLIVTVLLLSLYLSAFLSEIGAMHAIALAYSRVVQLILNAVWLFEI